MREYTPSHMFAAIVKMRNIVGVAEGDVDIVIAEARKHPIINNKRHHQPFSWLERLIESFEAELCLDLLNVIVPFSLPRKMSRRLGRNRCVRSLHLRQ